MRFLTDRYGRIHNYLRISLTDKCNLDCIYCNPENNHYKQLYKTDILSYENLLRIINIFVKQLGIIKVRFTGGEPFLRNNIMEFLEKLNLLRTENNFEIALTTNGILLENKLELLKNLNITRLNISLDTLQKKKFAEITGRDCFEKVISSIESALELGFNPIKINIVIIKGVNEDEIIDFIEFSIKHKVNIRFIEFMPFANNGWGNDSFISGKDIRKIIRKKFRIKKLKLIGDSVAADYSIENTDAKVSFITAISDNFCSSCNRLRITSNGFMKLCLFSTKSNEINLFELINNNKYSDSEIAGEIYKKMKSKKLRHPDVEDLLSKENNMIYTGG